MSLTLTVLPGEYAVAQLPAGSAVPDWATLGDLWCVLNAPDELSVVCPAAQVPDGVRVQRGWQALMLTGPFEFTLTGILASVLNPLRDAGVGIFALSTYNTDYVLVAASDLERSVAALRAAGHTVQD
ncbi:ACT domain-containing protein [Deinococcus soli (ex Cha et al. 2016)]|uniref:ACT domain-containing protein n=1 Tax=Deinococcus soli (ex Cha et al. 2016) TaxID=1309411 RepID=UPI00166AE404|nr:ACT domain-containing protein [Deinococcus soli (ex Cha et al. 2016)]GGB53148.1 ACT domain-containing protein [Deinococcus soli (ex Cha et al. 2016)]